MAGSLWKPGRRRGDAAQQAGGAGRQRRLSRALEHGRRARVAHDPERRNVGALRDDRTVARRGTATSSAKRIPNVWTLLQPGISRPGPADRRSSNARPSRRAANVVATGYETPSDCAARQSPQAAGDATARRGVHARSNPVRRTPAPPLTCCAGIITRVAREPDSVYRRRRLVAVVVLAGAALAILIVVVATAAAETRSRRLRPIPTPTSRSIASSASG